MKNRLLYIGLLFISGIIFASFGIFRHVPVFFAAAALFAALIFFIKRDFLFVIIFSALIFLLGAVRYEVHNALDPGHVKYCTPYRGERVFLEGTVGSDPEKTPNGRESFILDARGITRDAVSRAANGKVLVNILKGGDGGYTYGDAVVLEGVLYKPFSFPGGDTFDYRRYLRNKKIYSILSVKKGSSTKKIGIDEAPFTRFKNGLYSIRETVEGHITRFLDVPYSSLTSAILLGKRKTIPRDIEDLFAKTGTMHILAISGLHIGLIYLVLRVLFKILRFKRNFSVILAVGLLICYSILSGARPSVLRATTMFSILASSELLGRKISTLDLVGLSAIIILAVNPNQLFEVGFILSYGAVFSIVLISPRIYRLLTAYLPAGKAGTPPRCVRLYTYTMRSSAVSLAVWVGLAPVIAYYFGIISPVVIMANLVVVPLLFLIMASGIVFITLGFFFGVLGLLFSQSLWFFLALLIGAIRFLGAIPMAYFEITPPPFGVVMAYYAVLILLFNINRLRKLAFSFLT